MPYLDLDFKEKRFNVFTYFITVLLIIALTLGTYLYMRMKKEKEHIIKEGTLLFTSEIMPKGFIRMNKIEKGLLVVNGKRYLVNSKDTILISGIKFGVWVNDSSLTLKTVHFSRRIRW